MGCFPKLGRNTALSVPSNHEGFTVAFSGYQLAGVKEPTHQVKPWMANHRAIISYHDFTVGKCHDFQSSDLSHAAHGKKIRQRAHRLGSCSQSHCRSAKTFHWCWHWTKNLENSMDDVFGTSKGFFGPLGLWTLEKDLKMMETVGNGWKLLDILCQKWNCWPFSLKVTSWLILYEASLRGCSHRLSFLADSAAATGHCHHICRPWRNQKIKVGDSTTRSVLLHDHGIVAVWLTFLAIFWLFQQVPTSIVLLHSMSIFLRAQYFTIQPPPSSARRLVERQRNDVGQPHIGRSKGDIEGGGAEGHGVQCRHLVGAIIEVKGEVKGTKLRYPRNRFNHIT